MRPLIWLVGGLVCMGCSSGTSGSGGGSGGDPGGGCADFSGTWVRQAATCSDGSAVPQSTSIVTQSGCALTVTYDDGSRDQLTVSGNTIREPVSEGGATGVCEHALQGGSMNSTCSGQGWTCSFTSIRSGGGVGGAGGTGGVGGGGSCDGRAWTDPGACEDCMQANCCAALKACGPGTDCDALLQCAAPCGADTSCIQSQCASELQAGGSALQALVACNEQSCGACQ